MRKPDYARIAQLERDIFGETLTPAPARPVVSAAHEFDEFLREVLIWWVPWRPMPPELAGSRWAAGARLLCQLLVAFAATLIALMIAGVVPWAG